MTDTDDAGADDKYYRDAQEDIDKSADETDVVPLPEAPKSANVDRLGEIEIVLNNHGELIEKWAASFDEKQDYNFRIKRIEDFCDHIDQILPRLKREKIDTILMHMKELAKDLETSDSEYAPLLSSDHFMTIDKIVYDHGHKASTDYATNLIHKLMSAISVEHVVRKKILITMNLLNETLKKEYDRGPIMVDEQ